MCLFVQERCPQTGFSQRAFCSSAHERDGAYEPRREHENSIGRENTIAELLHANWPAVLREDAKVRYATCRPHHHDEKAGGWKAGDQRDRKNPQDRGMRYLDGQVR